MFDVFLGGACNPTQWRREIAIPFLESNSISFFNPQVENWSSDLVQIEAKAKESAKILFFVVDQQTRALATMIEILYSLARDRKICLVMNFDLERSRFLQRKLSNDENDDRHDSENVRRAEAVLKTFVEEKNVPTFEKIQPALVFIQKFIEAPITETKSNVLTQIPEKNIDLFVAFGPEDFSWFENEFSPQLDQLAVRYVEYRSTSDNTQLNFDSAQRSRLIFYLINDSDRLSDLLNQLSFLIGQRRHQIFVYLQTELDLKKTHVLTENERRDIERSRKYLQDLAVEENVSLFKCRERCAQSILQFFRDHSP